VLKNFVSDNDLAKYYANISSLLPNGQNDWSGKIATAFNNVLNELASREIDPRLCMVPVDLKLPTPVSNPPLTYTTEGAGTTGQAYSLGFNLRRLVVDVTVFNTDWTIQLQGTNQTTQPVTGDSTVWDNVISLSPVESGCCSIEFDNQYRWYRYVSTAGSGPLTYAAYIVENSWDYVIIQGALALIFNDAIRAPGDIWSERYAFAMDRYSSSWQGLKAMYDANDDGIPDQNTNDVRSFNLRMQR
jgi:hypothetical protein